jgi:hypothetical protein
MPGIAVADRVTEREARRVPLGVERFGDLRYTMQPPPEPIGRATTLPSGVRP